MRPIFGQPESAMSVPITRAERYPSDAELEYFMAADVVQPLLLTTMDVSHTVTDGKVTLTASGPEELHAAFCEFDLPPGSARTLAGWLLAAATAADAVEV